MGLRVMQVGPTALYEQCFDMHNLAAICNLQPVQLQDPQARRYDCNCRTQQIPGLAKSTW